MNVVSLYRGCVYFRNVDRSPERIGNSYFLLFEGVYENYWAAIEYVDQLGMLQPS